MKKIINLLFLASTMLFLVNCSSSKNATDLKTSTGNLSGLWTVSDIKVNLPDGFKVSDVFDEAPYKDFMNSKWDLKRNGKGSYTLNNGVFMEKVRMLNFNSKNFTEKKPVMWMKATA